MTSSPTTTVLPTTLPADAVATTPFVDPTTTAPPPPVMQPSDWLPSAEVPALCGNQPGRLVAGELPDAFLVVDPDAAEPASVTLLDAPSPIVGDIDNDGRAEVIAATLCTYPSYYYPDGYQSLIAYDDRQAMVGEVTIDGYFGALSTDDAGVVVEWTTCEPEILACIPAGAHVGHLRRSAPGNLELVEDDAPTATTGIDASVALAPCVAVASMSIGMHGHRPEVALLQAELQRRGFDPGSIDGYFGANTMTAAISESQANAPADAFEYGVDEGTVLDTMFRRLGIAC